MGHFLNVVPGPFSSVSYILSRIEGDDTKVKHSLLEKLITTIETQLLALTGEDKKIESVSISKLKEMQGRLSSGYTSFWS